RRSATRLCGANTGKKASAQEPGEWRQKRRLDKNGQSMRFYVRKRRQAPAVIIVALIDVLIVLLIFLMVTTAFKQQPALKLVLPESYQAQKTGSQESPPLVVTVDPQGKLRLGSEGKPVTVVRLRNELL